MGKFSRGKMEESVKEEHGEEAETLKEFIELANEGD